MEGINSKIPRHFNTIFQIPPSRNCISQLAYGLKKSIAKFKIG
jgi:hypothetical protein